MPVKWKVLLVFSMACLFDSTFVFASDNDSLGINKQMQQWVDWVLYDNKDYHCPSEFTNYTVKHCAWPSTLALKLSNKKGSFRQDWVINSKTSLQIPGSSKNWPLAVTANNKKIPVTEVNGLPVIFLNKGRYSIRGEFAWSKLPDVLKVSANTALVSLSVNNKNIARPEIASDGKIWVTRSDADNSKGETDSLESKIYRRIIDEIPLQVETILQLSVSGKSREIFLEPLLTGLIPLELSSVLPVRLENDRRLRVQVRPGQWQIRLLGRYPNPVQQLSLNENTSANELWVFDARNNLRVVELSGLTSIDPRQTTLPQRWHNLPAYQIKQNEILQFKELRRGDPDPQPDKLNLVRHLWLDFAGKGYNFKDTINGTMTHDWRINAIDGIELGSVSIDGQPQFITKVAGDDTNQGVEVRHGNLNIEAESRYVKSRGNIPASGWDKDFSSVQATLHIPPGFKIFSISGVDNDPRSWLQQWTLLDLFLVLVISIAIFRLSSWPVALLALFTMAITWHQGGAPQSLWFGIILGTALYKVIKHEKYQKLIVIFLAVNFMLLLFVTIPFAIKQVRVAIYPQLEYQWKNIQSVPGSTDFSPRQVLPEAATTLEKAEDTSSRVYKKLRSFAGVSQAPALYNKRDMYEIDPGAVVQTGFGTPQWQWQQVPLRWNGPVKQSQQINITYIPPWLNSVLGFLRVISIIALAGLLVRISGVLSGNIKTMFSKAAVTGVNIGLFVLVSLFAYLPANNSYAADYPPEKLLKQLESRLLLPPDCKNQCASIARMNLDISNNNLSIRLEVHAEENTSIPVPAHRKYWMPEKVIVNGKTVPPMQNKNGQLWIVVQRGVQQILMSGKISQLSQFQLPMPLKPFYGKAKVNGWVVDGLHDDGKLDSTLQFSRKTTNKSGKLTTFEPSELPPFLRVERLLQLGLDWTMTTRVTRLNNYNSAIVAEIPLIQGEAVTTNNIRVENGKVMVNMPPKARQFEWTSTLNKSIVIKLKALNTSTYTEVWKGQFSPTWHVESSGVPVIQHVQDEGNWLPEWHPWPGEELQLDISRPAGIDGPTVTIEKSHRLVKPGLRATDTMLSLSVRSSKGTQHSITLPEGAELQSVTIDGQLQPIRQSGRMVNLPLHPGQQQFQVTWRENTGIQFIFNSADIDLNLPSINHSTKIELGRDRWVLLLKGSVMGPAILFWGVLLVVLMLAYALGKITITPLKSWQWVLLCIGLTQIDLIAGIVIVGWLFALGLRRQLTAVPSAVKFNLLQIGLLLWSLLALSSLYQAISHGLLGFPDMQVVGNQSDAYNLNWFWDRSENILPGTLVVSTTLVIYRLVMLAWALWLAFSLVKWISWAWQCVSHNGIWKHVETRKNEKEQTEIQKIENK